VAEIHRNRLARAFAGLALNPQVTAFTLRQIGMLLLLDVMGRREVNEIACTMQCSKPVVTRAASAFEHHGLARRIKHEDDLRRVSIELTEKGREVAALFNTVMGRAFDV